MRRALLLVPVWAWLLLFVAAPVAILVAIALAEADPGLPPFRLAFSVAGFALLAEDAYYLDAFLSALWVAGLTAGLCLLVAYPMAIAVARAAPGRRVMLLALVMLPFWTGFMLRVGAWIGLLRDQGWINGMLMSLGIIHEPLHLLYTQGAMLVGMVHAYLPFAVLPLYAALVRLDHALLEAAEDLGARPVTAFLTVTLPVTAPAAIAAFLLVFIPAAGEFIIPELMGPPEAQLVGRVLWQEFFQNRDWPVAASLAVVLLALLILPIRLFQRLEGR